MGDCGWLAMDKWEWGTHTILDSKHIICNHMAIWVRLWWLWRTVVLFQGGWQKVTSPQRSVDPPERNWVHRIEVDLALCFTICTAQYTLPRMPIDIENQPPGQRTRTLGYSWGIICKIIIAQGNSNGTSMRFGQSNISDERNYIGYFKPLIPEED